MISQTDILEELKKSSDEYQHVLLGTYSFDPDFFEEKILPVFTTKDAETILVLTDKNEYQKRFSDMSTAGHEYYIDYCYASQIFHPKFILLTWSEGIKLFLGSVNLTKQAWFDSAEMVGSVTYLYNTPDKQAEKVLSDFREYLSKIIEKQFIKSKKHESKILEIIKKLPQNYDKVNSEIKLVHNIDEPILEQIKKVIDEPIESVKILAPFFNKEGSVLDFFVDIGCKKFEIFIQPKKVRDFPKKKINELISKNITINTNQIKFKENENRYIHAKIIIIKTKSNSYCIYGSPNPTFSGMLSTPNKGNMELGVICKNPTQNYFDQLIQNDSIQIEKVGLDEISDTKNEKIESEKIIQDNLSDSYFEDKLLILNRERTDEIFNIVLAHTEEEFLKIPTNSDKQKLEIKLNEKQFLFCSRPTYVYLEYNDNERNIQSNKRWISTQTLELTPRRMDIERIQKSDGRYGLIAFLNKLEQFTDDSDWFYYLLQRVKFEKLSSLEPVRRRLVERKYDYEENLEYEIPPKTDIVSIFKIKFEKNKKTIKDSLESIEELEIEEFDKLFNQFLAWSKVVTWFVLRNEAFVDELRYVRANIEEFLKIIRRLSGENEFKEHLDKIDFWYHIVLFSYLIFKFHKKAGFMQKNKGVVGTFFETTKEIIQDFGINHDQLDIKKMNFVIEEYGEFEDLEIDILEMERMFIEEFKSKIIKNN